MTFRIILTILLSLGIGIYIEQVGKKRKPITIWDAWFNVILNAVIIYGLWNWL